jgi:hypothetical protein
MRFIAPALLTFAVAGLLRWLDFPLWLAVLGGVVAALAVPWLLALAISARQR